MKTVIMIVIAAMLLIAPAYAVGTDEVMQSQSDALNLDELEDAVPDSASDYMNGLSITDSSDLGEGLGQIIEMSGADVGGILRNGIRSVVIILVIVMFCGVAESLFEGTGSKKIPTYITIAGVLAIAAVSAGNVSAFIGLGKSAIEDMDTFSKSLLPTLTAAAAASGSPVASSMRQVVTVFFSDVLITAINTVLLPLVYVYISACIANAAVGGSLGRIANLIKWVVSAALKVLLIVFTTYLAISGVIAGTTDALALKTAKVTISGVVPVVGSIISDAAETVLAGASILRNSIGVFGMLAVIAICAIPFLQIGIHYILYKVAGGLAGTMHDGRLTGLIDDIGSAFGIILGMTAACALMIFVSVISAITAVTGV